MSASFFVPKDNTFRLHKPVPIRHTVPKFPSYTIALLIAPISSSYVSYAASSG